MKHIYPVCIPAPIAYIQLSETCQLSVQHAHVNQCYVEALLTQGKVSGFLLLKTSAPALCGTTGTNVQKNVRFWDGKKSDS